MNRHEYNREKVATASTNMAELQEFQQARRLLIDQISDLHTRARGLRNDKAAALQASAEALLSNELFDLSAFRDLDARLAQVEHAISILEQRLIAHDRMGPTLQVVVPPSWV